MFKSIHLALPVTSLEKAVSFFTLLFDAEVIVRDHARRTCTVAYDRFEYSLFELPHFLGWPRSDLGPFHIGHELYEREQIDVLFAKATSAGYRTLSAPFEREDGDYAFFVKDDTGIVFEFFSGGHAAARRRTQQSAYVEVKKVDR